VKVSVKNQGKCEKVLTIQVTPDRVKDEYNKYYAEVSKTARIPGFRPGRAPKEVIAMHYAHEAKEAVLKHLIQESTFEALKNEKIEPLYYPAVSKVSFEGEQLSFDAVVELRPEVKLGSYKGLKVKQTEVKVEDAQVAETIQRVQESYAKFIPVENRAVREGDFLVTDLDCEIEGKKMDTRKDDWFEVNPKKMQPELVKGVLGMSLGETRTVDVNFAKDFAVKDYAGKHARFTVRLKEIKSQELPAVTDEWVQGLGEFKTVDEFRAKIREDLLQQKQNDEDRRFENELLDALLKNTKIEVPSGAVERRLAALVEDAKKRLTAQGLSQTDLEKQEKELNEKLRPEAEKQLKIAFAFEEIAKVEKLEAREQDLEAKFQEMSERSKVALEKVKQYYSESEDRRENLIHQLTNDKVLKFLKENAKL